VLADDLHAMACLSSLASADLTLPDGTELFMGGFSLVQPDAPSPGSDHQAFEALVQEYDDVFNLPIGIPLIGAASSSLSLTRAMR
jgi:hypothetical protein